MKGLSALVFLLMTAPVCADENSSKLGEIKAEIHAVTGDIQRLEKERSTLLEQLGVMETRYGKILVSLSKMQSQIIELQQKLRVVRDESAHLKHQMSGESKELANQLKAAFAMGRTEKLKLILNQEDPALSSRILVYYEYLNKARLSKIREIDAAVLRLAELEQTSQEESVRLTEALEAKKAEQQELSDTRAARKDLLAKLNKERLSNQQRLMQLQKNERTLQELIEKINLANLKKEQVKEKTETSDLKKAHRTFNSKQPELKETVGIGLNRPFGTLKGRLSWPVSGQLLKKFGSSRLNTKWDGVLIGAPEGADVRAITKGKVVFADWLRGYGLLIIVDHGSGYMTLYAFNQSLYKAVGDSVKVGDVIASVGKSGGRRRAGLYFGIRHNGKAIDPARWCEK